MNSNHRRSPLAVVALAAAGLLTTLSAWAFDVGHSRVSSAPGQALVADVTLNNLTEGDLQTLNISVAPPADWAQAGLVPPVPLATMRVQVLPGRSAASRTVRVSSSVASERSVIDLVLEVVTGSARRQIQASVIVPAPPSIRAASGQSITVLRGDTLIGIANRFPVAGADLYQMLWALFQANPQAFIAENMNLLRAGAALSIPDAATVRAVDPRLARERYLAHVQAFRNLRGGIGSVPALVGTQSDGSAMTAQGKVEFSSAPAAQAPAEDKVRLSAPKDDTAVDRQASVARAADEEKSRLQQLTQNIEALKEASAVASAAASVPDTPGSSALEAAGAAATPTAAATPSGIASPSPITPSTLTPNGAGSTTGATVSPSGVAGASDTLAGPAGGLQIDAVTHAKQWVLDNVVASIAIVLALLALILAWALRSPGRRDEDKDDEPMVLDSEQAEAFKEKLQDIDLSLDNSGGEKPAAKLPDARA